MNLIPAARLRQISSAAEAPIFWTLLGLLVAVVVVSGPVLTSDGPSHLSMAHFILLAGDPASPMLNRIYEMNPQLSPNALGHFVLAGFMLIVPPLVAEQTLQIVCLVSVPLAARLTLQRLSPDAGWISLFFFPVALQRLFFLGLYNFCLSLTGCILCIWAYLRLRERASFANIAILALMLLVTLACQASGWMESVVAIGAMVTTESVLRLVAGERALVVTRLPALTLASLAPGAALFALFALQNVGNHDFFYGPSPLQRLLAVVRGDAFATIGRSTALVSCALGATLLVMLIIGGITVLRNGQPGMRDRWLQPATLMLPLSFLAFVLIIPDEAGGGWTHTWRAEAFPYIGLALACAILPTPWVIRTAAIAATTAGSLVTIAMTFWLQAWEVPPVARKFAAVDKLIGPHCTIAPVLADFKLDPANTAQVIHHPLFHIASRIELRSDRPVLFSYHARLPIYPIRFRPDADPMRLLFGWESEQTDTHVYKVDIAGFEAATGIAVDYVLLWDVPGPDHAGPFQDLRSATLAHYKLVHHSPSGRLELYQRLAPGGCVKP